MQRPRDTMRYVAQLKEQRGDIHAGFDSNGNELDNGELFYSNSDK